LGVEEGFPGGGGEKEEKNPRRQEVHPVFRTKTSAPFTLK
jgi:hypothetical protein